jgi:hypothetical protein
MRITELLENQNFDLDRSKQSIINWIIAAIKGRVEIKYNPFYDVISGGNLIQAGSAKTAGFSSDFVERWKSYFSSNSWINDGGSGPWAQYNIGDQFQAKSGGDRTYNFYITVNKDPKNVAVFFAKYHTLAAALKPISDKFQTPIKFKTHRLLDSFLGHNDSFKVYYYDADLKNTVVAAVNKWLNDNSIQVGTRVHQHGVDIKSGGGSFGQIISNQVATQFAKMIQQYGTKYTPEQYYEWIKTHLPSMVSRIQPDMKNL